MDKKVYLFSEGDETLRNLLGGKSVGLAEMMKLGLNVPEGFTISTQSCNDFYKNNQTIDSKTKKEIKDTLIKLEKITGKKLGSSKEPLLLSIRSGARVSMPGMMDTVLNLGMNEEIIQALIEKTKNERFVYDTYRRFIQMYSDVIKGIERSHFEEVLDNVKKNEKVKNDNEISVLGLKEVIKEYKKIYKKEIKEDFPQDPMVQLFTSIEAVFKSWNTSRAKYYRELNNIPHEWGTAVNVQRMVFGNMGDDSATGVAFTRNPATGEKKLYGEFLFNAQGEDVVAGIRTPFDIIKLKDTMPNIYKEFKEKSTLLEKRYKDMQDLEFTIENSKLYFLQTRNGKRTAQAAVKIAKDLVKEKVLTKKEALLSLNPNQLEALLHDQFDNNELKKISPDAKGLPASPGAAFGRVVFDQESIKKFADKNEPTILVRLETSPEDIEGMNVSQGILTVRGGMTSHAAVVARGMGKCCVAGCSDITIFEKEKYFTTKDKKVKEGDYISLDGSSGNVYFQKISTTAAKINEDFQEILSWADQYRTLKIYANADNDKIAKIALDFGAEGIGLCRTEHMFFEKERILALREMIFANSTEKREKALDKILPYQKEDFKNLYLVMKEYPITIRLLDPPLHEFLPKTDIEINELAKKTKTSVSEINARIEKLHEINPMMGHRGCRLLITYPEIAKMQTRAILEAAVEVKKSKGYEVNVEIMIPLVSEINELTFLKDIIKEECEKIILERKVKINYKIGTMIETPRACLISDQIAKVADFVSFGTNDLTQMTYGFSRDDIGKFLPDYYKNKIIKEDPFSHVDSVGVGSLLKIAKANLRNYNKNYKIGICGGHAGDPKSVKFFDELGFTYVSSSPYNVVLVKLAAAQASINKKNQ